MRRGVGRREKERGGEGREKKRKRDVIERKYRVSNETKKNEIWKARRRKRDGHLRERGGGESVGGKEGDNQLLNFQVPR